MLARMVKRGAAFTAALPLPCRPFLYVEGSFQLIFEFVAGRLPDKGQKNRNYPIQDLVGHSISCTLPHLTELSVIMNIGWHLVKIRF
jgi:hypothetical protein